jgi:hypothetical protein
MEFASQQPYWQTHGMNPLRTLCIFLPAVLAGCKGTGAARTVTPVPEAATGKAAALQGKRATPPRRSDVQHTALGRMELRIRVLQAEGRSISPQFPYLCFPEDIFDRMADAKARVAAANNPEKRAQATAELQSLTEQLDRTQREIQALEPLIRELKHLEAECARLSAELDRAGN